MKVKYNCKTKEKHETERFPRYLAILSKHKDLDNLFIVNYHYTDLIFKHQFDTFKGFSIKK